jgi:hypothetical protein
VDRLLLAIFAASVAVTLVIPSALADAAPVCVGTGVLAVQRAPTSVPEPIGPVITGPSRAGARTDASVDATTGLSVESSEFGVSGCLDDQGTPGGSALRVGAWSLLHGAIRGASLRADLVPAAGDGTGWRLRTTVDDLRIAGRPVTVTPGDEVPVGDWGVLRAQRTVERMSLGGVRWWRAALQLRLVAAHGGFPAGTSFLIGWAAADRAPAPPPLPPPPPPATTTTATTTAPATTTTPKPMPKPAPLPPKPKPKPTTNPAPAVHPTAKARPKTKRKVHRKPAVPSGPRPITATPPLGNDAYMFPVAGDVSWGDTYGGARSDVSDGWHHGDDLFASLGTPVVAVTDGIVFSVGWNRVGGWRLWLIDRSGNEFYYAHLSGYTKLGKDNLHVRRGDVLGFVGNTGDAVTTDSHLHFEIHPAALLYLGYDGAVDPTAYLRRWRQPTSVKALPPVALPGSAPTGWGSAVDFRRLLALRPMKRPVHTAPVDPVAKPKATRNAVGRAKMTRVASTKGPGPVPAIVGLLLIASASLGVLYSRRSAPS